MQLATTLGSVPRIRAILEGMNQPALAYLIEQLDAIPELESLISAAIAPEAPQRDYRGWHYSNWALTRP